SYIKNVDVTHETSDVNVPALLKFVLALTIMMVVAFGIVLFLFSFLNSQETKKEPPAGPMAMTEQESLPPEPRLQSAPGFAADLSKSVGETDPHKPKDPLWEIRVLREQWDRDLREGAKDQSGRTLGIPIEEAMKKLVAEQNAKAGANSKAQSGEGYGDQMPTAASSGRISEKGKQ
ncbi:MAG TPA: hypothetical protein VFH15_08060, partial [Pyrinomonadaceae bacterium]|nr:hypothetical protein [Pyrinomonadaceae bacterium]